MNVGRSLSVSLNKEYQREIQELCESQGYTTHKQLFNAAIAALKAQIDGGDADIDSRLLSDNERLKKKVSALEGELKAARGSGSQAGSSPSTHSTGDFVAKVPSIAREKVDQFVQAMYEEHGYTSKSEILRHWIALHDSIGKGEKIIVKVSKRLMRLLEKFSAEPIDNGDFTDVGHYAGQKLQEALIQKEKASSTEPAPGKKANSKPKKEGDESEEEEFNFWGFLGF